MSETRGVDVSSTISDPSKEQPLQIPTSGSTKPENPERRNLFKKVLLAVGLGALAGATGATAAESALHGGTDKPPHPLNLADQTPLAGAARQETTQAQAQPTQIQPPELTSYTGDPTVDEGIARKQATSGGLDDAKKRLADSLANNPKAK